MAKSGRLEQGDNILLTLQLVYHSIFNHKAIKLGGKNAKYGLLRRSSFIQGHLGRSVSIESPYSTTVIDILSRICRSGVIELIVQILDTLRFEPPFGALGTTYDVHLGLIGKRVVDFLY